MYGEYMTHRLNITVPDHVYAMIVEYEKRNPDIKINISGVCTNAIADRIRAVYPGIDKIIEQQFLKPASSPGEAHTEKEESNTQEPEDKPAKEPRRTQAGNKEKGIIKKICKNCQKEFDATNPRQESCTIQCKKAYSKRNKKAKPV